MGYARKPAAGEYEGALHIQREAGSVFFNADNLSLQIALK